MQLGVSILICCHNSAQRIPDTLRHLSAQKVPESVKWEVVVIDNASTDKTELAAVSCWPKNASAPIRVVREPRVGLNFARMCGIAVATYEFISFIDDDNWVCVDWVAQVIRIFEQHPDVGACGGPSQASFEVEPPNWFNHYSYAYAVGEQADHTGYVPMERGFLWGAGLSLRQSAIQKLQLRGFRFLSTDRQGKHLSGGGDNELCFALLMAGWQLWYEESLTLHHNMTAPRLNWQYLRRLHCGFGSSYINLAPYRQAMTRFSNSLPVKYHKRWYIQALWLVKQFLLTDGIDSLLVMFRRASKENYTILRYEILKGCLRELWKQKDNYERNFTIIAMAEWQQYNLQSHESTTL